MLNTSGNQTINARYAKFNKNDSKKGRYDNDAEEEDEDEELINDDSYIDYTPAHQKNDISTHRSAINHADNTTKRETAEDPHTFSKTSKLLSLI